MYDIKFLCGLALSVSAHCAMPAVFAGAPANVRKKKSIDANSVSFQPKFSDDPRPRRGRRDDLAGLLARPTEGENSVMGKVLSGVKILYFAEFTCGQFGGRDPRAAWLVLEFTAHVTVYPMKVASVTKTYGLQAIL